MNSDDQYIIYADESGTGRKRNGSDPIPTLAGWIDTKANWESFKYAWQAVHEAYPECLIGSDGKPTPFHCCKIMDHYSKAWATLPRLPEYIHELAFVAARTALPVGTANKHDDDEGDSNTTYDKNAIRDRRNTLPPDFFANVLNEFKRTGKNGTALFVFESGDKEWTDQEIAEGEKWKEAYSKAGVNLATPYIANKNDIEHALPLQAADLLASVARKAVNSLINFSSHPLRFILCYRILQFEYVVKGQGQPPKHMLDVILPTLPFEDFEPRMRAYLQRRQSEEKAKLQAAGDSTRTYCPFYGGICDPSKQV